MSDSENDDLHKMVMKGAFEDFKSRSETVVVNGLIHINRNVLLLFSPFLRDIVSTIPGLSDTSSIILPETSIKTIIKLQELLTTGGCSDAGDVKDAKELLETLQSLGVDITQLKYSRSNSTARSETEVELGDDDHVQQSVENAVKAGKDVVFTLKKTVSDEPESNENSSKSPIHEESTTTSSSPTMQIKKERVFDAEEPSPTDVSTENSSPEPMDQDQQQHVQEKPEAQPQEPAQNPQEQVAAASENVKNQCEKCQKAFSNVNQLKHHYCGHFPSIIKKKFASSYKDQKCLECSRVFPTVEKVLLHLGIIHDKINIILKLKGLKELPPNSLTNPGANNTKQQDVKNVSLIKRPLVINETPFKNSPSTPVSSTPSTAPPPKRVSTSAPPTPALEKKSLDEECNFDLHCQVCNQKQNSLHSLEQHLSRHFMKEIQDKFSNLMDDLKCCLCHSVFKQKHSLVMHIGCKHGKINEILKEKNLKVLPAPVLNNTSNVMQKQLILVKKERAADSDNSPTQHQQEETLVETSNLTIEKPPASAESNNSSVEIENILKKYNFQRLNKISQSS